MKIPKIKLDIFISYTLAIICSIIVLSIINKIFFRENFILWGGRNLESNQCLIKCTGLRENEYRVCAQKCRENDIYLNRLRAATILQ